MLKRLDRSMHPTLQLIQVERLRLGHVRLQLSLSGADKGESALGPGHAGQGARR
jgi:hypothetical protein